MTVICVEESKREGISISLALKINDLFDLNAMHLLLAAAAAVCSLNLFTISTLD